MNERAGTRKDNYELRKKVKELEQRLAEVTKTRDTWAKEAQFWQDGNQVAERLTETEKDLRWALAELDQLNLESDGENYISIKYTIEGIRERMAAR